MYYSKWSTKSDLENSTIEINLKEKNKKSGIPVYYENDKCYTTKGDSHTLVIGSTGSGKTQSITFPLIKFSMLADESIVVTDGKGEIYNRCADILEKNGYKVFAINFFDSTLGNGWNPLMLPYKLFQDSKIDACIESLTNLGYYLFYTPNTNSDPFWENSANDLFVGLSLYLFNKAKVEEINFNSIYSLCNEVLNGRNLLEDLDKDSPEYMLLSGILLAPKETMGSIIAVFLSKIKIVTTRPYLSRMLANNDIKLDDLKGKFAIFLITDVNACGSTFIPLFVHQLFDTINTYIDNNRRVNVILDEFDTLKPIKDFSQVINYSRSININFTVLVKSYTYLKNTYGEENLEIIKLCFGNTIYLMTNDLTTLEDISKACGNKGNNTPLVTVDDLKGLDIFEAVILLPRELPFRTKLVPDFKIDWGFECKEKELTKGNFDYIRVYNDKEGN